MGKNRNRIFLGIIIIAVLAAAYLWGGNAPGLKGKNHTEVNESSAVSVELGEENGVESQFDNISIANTENTEKSEEAYKAEENTETAESGSIEYSVEKGMEIDPSTGVDQYKTEPVPEGKPVPVEEQEAEITEKEFTCTLSVRCDTILSNMDWLDQEKWELVPEDGVIFAKQSVVFYEGESVFNVLLREMKKNKIHMEFENTPMYNSAYIRGIGNLYEFDCGEGSGWMYKVNGWFPNYGCSRYQLEDGDEIEWVYTCDLGRDVGGSNY
jgi:hypothetical protein